MSSFDERLAEIEQQQAELAQQHEATRREKQAEELAAIRAEFAEALEKYQQLTQQCEKEFDKACTAYERAEKRFKTAGEEKVAAQNKLNMARFNLQQTLDRIDRLERAVNDPQDAA